MTDIEEVAALARGLLYSVPSGSRYTTIEEISLKAAEAIHLWKFRNPGSQSPSQADVVRYVETLVMVAGPEAAVLADDRDHQAWLAEERLDIDWLLWERYKIALQQKGFPPNVVNGIDEITDDLLSRLESPRRYGSWDRRGLVVGQVQSGKTANYTGLICKAADAGYKLIVVMAGLHNSLRAQTQHRLDLDFLGWNSQSNQRIGVGLTKASALGTPKAMSVTDSSEKGDFSVAVAQKLTMELGSQPVIAVIKKNASVLNSFLKWVLQLNADSNSPNQRSLVRDIPLLLIDDEADNASINTGKADDDPTTINRLVRSILHNFEKSAYVGYTATPYANIFVDDRVQDEEVGEDLFPKSFIVRLKPPSNYVGADAIFGSSATEPMDPQARGLPVTKQLSDYGSWMPYKHKSSFTVPDELPGSLKEAIQVFVLGCAVRNLRGDSAKHKSMLIHVTRYNAIQDAVRERVREFYMPMRDALLGRDVELLVELEELWNREFVEKHADFLNLSKPFAKENNLLPTFDEIAEQLPAAASKVQIRTINGSAGDVLDYSTNENGLSVIAIGGDKLSRGLTLEGLSVSYYLRATTMYDTLMQMGRWFGYRPKYLDLCRLYTTGELINWYRDIVRATDELMEEFDAMAAAGETPETYGLRVRSHPGELLVTAVNKMRNSTEHDLTFQGDVSETLVYDSSYAQRVKSFEWASTFVATLSEPSPDHQPNFVWEHIAAEQILTFLEGLAVHQESRRARPDLWVEYIKAQLQRGDLSDWTVLLRSLPRKNGAKGTDRPPVSIGGREVVAVLRNDDDHDLNTGVYRIGRLLQSSDESYGLSDIQLRAAEAKSRRKGDKTVSGRLYRSERPPTSGLLILYPVIPSFRQKAVDPSLDPPYIGVGVSFPPSENAEKIKYRVNNRYEQEIKELYD